MQPSGRADASLTGKMATSRLAASNNSSKIPLNFRALRIEADSKVKRRV